MKYENILGVIGNTPHIRLSNLFPRHEVWLKLEKQNPGGSIKDRIVFAMIEDAERRGVLKSGATIIEPTSGNTGVGLAWVGAIKGYKIVIVMPESMSLERRRLIALYGAKLVLTSREKGMKGAIEHAKELQRKIRDAWIPQQFENAANPFVHEVITAHEIIVDFPEGLDYLITGIGTGGHISGVGKALKKQMPSIQIIGVEPYNSAVISGKTPGAHALQGIGAGFVPHTLDTSLLDGAMSISKEEAFEYTRRLAKEEGILGGISTGASLAAVAKKLSESDKCTRVLTFNYDTGERYLSVKGLF